MSKEPGPDSRNGPKLPVTVAVSRRVATENRGAAREWADGLVNAAQRFPGYLDSEIHVKDRNGGVDIVVGLNFERAQNLVAWEESDERVEHVRRGDELTQGAPVGITLANLDLLWNAPREATPAPQRWKTALWVWTALTPAAVLLNVYLVPHLGGLPVILRTLLSTVILVLWVIWLGLPAVHYVRTRLGTYAKSFTRVRNQPTGDDTTSTR